MSEWSIVLVSKTSVVKATGGSNPPLCAKNLYDSVKVFLFFINFFAPPIAIFNHNLNFNRSLLFTPLPQKTQNGHK